MRAHLDYLLQTIEICHLLGGEMVTMHPFHLFQTHASWAGLLDEFLDQLSGSITNLHIADFIPPDQRLVPGRGALDWGRLLPSFNSLPRLRQMTLELYRTESEEIVWAAQMLAGT